MLWWHLASRISDLGSRREPTICQGLPCTLESGDPPTTFIHLVEGLLDGATDLSRPRPTSIEVIACLLLPSWPHRRANLVVAAVMAAVQARRRDRFGPGVCLALVCRRAIAQRSAA